MAIIHNSDLFKELKEGGRLQQAIDILPSQLADKVVPVMEVNPKMMRRCNFTSNVSARTTSGSLTLLSSDSNKDTYITNLQVTLIKDAACDVATGGILITVTIDGATKNLHVLSVITLTAQQYEINLNFPIPLKIDRGSSIAFGGTFTAGVMVRGGGVQGYTIDNPNA